MSRARRFAAWLLDAAARHALTGAGEWASAMRGEMDEIPGDLAAALWALGSLTSLVTYFGTREVGARLRQRFGVCAHPSNWRGLGLATAELVSGVALAGGVLGLAITTELTVLRMSWNEFARTPMTDRALLVAAVEVVLVAGAVMLPRRRRPLIAGIVLCGMTIAMHLAAHG